MSPRVPSAGGHTDRVVDDECFDPRLIAEITLLATPIDFDELIARGILKQASADWYWLLVPSRELPDGFSRRIAAATSSSNGLKVRLWSVKAAARVA